MDMTTSGLTDHHIHTSLCNHAEGGMEAFAEQAARVKLKGICFLDHLILNPIGRNQSMRPDDVGLYFLAAERLKQAYRDVLDVKVGLEVDFDPEFMPRIEGLINRFAFDVIGGSVHFTDGRNIVSRRFNRNQKAAVSRDLWEGYLVKLNEMVSCGCFDLICHLDVPKKHGHPLPEVLVDAFDELLVNIAARGCAVEINTSGLDHPVGEIYPAHRLVAKCTELGVPLVLGSDAHRPAEVGRYFNTTVSVLKSLGVKHVSEFTARKRAIIPFPS